MRSRLAPALLACALALGFRAACGEAPPKQLALPVRIVETQPWDADGQSYAIVVDDPVHGRLTVTMRLAAVDEKTYTLQGEGTDYRVTWPLPAEDRASGLLTFKRRELGEPLDAAKRERLLAFCLAARYFRYALAELNELPAASRAAWHARLAEARAVLLLRHARLLTERGLYEDAGRASTEALAVLAEPPPETPAPAAPPAERKALEDALRTFQVDLTAARQASTKWSAAVARLKAALEGAQGEDATLIARLSLDLDGPLDTARREAILNEHRLSGEHAMPYSQALDALKSFSFAVRYGETLDRKSVPDLDLFFTAEEALNAYFRAAPNAVDLPQRLEAALAARGLTDEVFEALVRLGARAPLPPRPEPGASPQGPFELKAPTGDLEVACRYSVCLPPDYHPSRRRPLLIALHGMNGTALDALKLWAPQAAERGWIVAAPELIIGRGKGYLSSPEERRMARRTLEDCARHFAVDPSRVYLAGHSMGGHMTWDVALTWPDLFAAAAPFIGCANGVSANYLPNLAHLPMLCIDGENDGESTKVNRAAVEEAKRLKLPLTYKEFPGRGHETFAEELPGVLDWLGEARRPRAPKQVDFVSADVETSQVHWLRMIEAQAPARAGTNEPRENVLTALRAGGVARLTASIAGANAVKLTAFRVKAARLFVARELFDPRQPLKVTVNGGITRTFPLEFSRKTMLETAHASGDRERLYGCWVDVPVGR